MDNITDGEKKLSEHLKMIQIRKGLARDRNRSIHEPLDKTNLSKIKKAANTTEKSFEKKPMQTNTFHTKNNSVASSIYNKAKEEEIELSHFYSSGNPSVHPSS